MPGGKIDEETKAAIELTTLCKGLHQLPRSGGLLDQDFYEVALLNAGLWGIAKLEAKQERDREIQRKREGGR